MRLPPWIKEWLQQQGTLYFVGDIARTTLSMDANGWVYMKVERLPGVV